VQQRRHADIRTPVSGLRNQAGDLDQMVDVGLRLLALPLLARMFARGEVNRMAFRSRKRPHPLPSHAPMGAFSTGDRQSAKGERLALKGRSPAAGSKKGRVESSIEMQTATKPARCGALMIRTSETHPLRIDAVDPGAVRGLIGITFAPGKHDRFAVGGPWARDIAKDLDAIVEWKARAVVTLIEPHEMSRLCITNLGAEVQRRDMVWLHLPIRDVSTPSVEFEAGWPAHYATTMFVRFRSSKARGPECGRSRARLQRDGAYRASLEIVGGLAEFERELIRTRTGEGRARAKTRGVHMGRPPKLTENREHQAVMRGGVCPNVGQ
jgi:hypothetical protein